MKFLNTHIHSDFVSQAQIIPDNSIDLTVTSPPYDDIRNYNKQVKTKKGDKFSFDFDGIVNQLYRVTKDGGVVVWVVNDQVKNGGETGNSFRQALRFIEKGFTLYDTMIYMKNGAPFPEKTRYSQVFEYMFVFSKGSPKTVNILKDKKNKWAGHTNFGKRVMRTKDGELKEMPKFEISEYGNRYNVWTYSTGKNYSTKDDFAFEHPAIFPEELAEDHILSWSNEGDIVLDPMVGSGTTSKMAKLNNRNFIGFDINQEYISIANRRVDQIIPYNQDNPNPKSGFIMKKK
jgi:site-specific DNA-methyltransferase (adenine-specific)